MALTTVHALSRELLEARRVHRFARDDMRRRAIMGTTLARSSPHLPSGFSAQPSDQGFQPTACYLYDVGIWRRACYSSRVCFVG
jgi:hypothetical protein